MTIKAYELCFMRVNDLIELIMRCQDEIRRRNIILEGEYETIVSKAEGKEVSTGDSQADTGDIQAGT